MPLSYKVQKKSKMMKFAIQAKVINILRKYQSTGMTKRQIFKIKAHFLTHDYTD